MPPQDDDDIRQQRDLVRQTREQSATQWDAIYQQIDQLTQLVNTQVLPTASSSANSGYALTTSAQELTRVTFTVPSGYTQAQVNGVGSMSCFNQNSTTIDRLFGYVDINGTAPQAQVGWAQPASAGNVTGQFALTLTGLSAGGSFYVRFMAWNGYGNTGAGSALNVCTLSAEVLFLH